MARSPNRLVCKVWVYTKVAVFAATITIVLTQWYAWMAPRRVSLRDPPVLRTDVGVVGSVDYRPAGVSLLFIGEVIIPQDVPEAWNVVVRSADGTRTLAVGYLPHPATVGERVRFAYEDRWPFGAALLSIQKLEDGKERAKK